MKHLIFIQTLHELLQQNNIVATDWEIRSLGLVNSTNDIVNDLLMYYTSVIALATSQSSGRGRNNNHWESPEGGIWLSIGIKKSTPIIELSTPVVKTVKEILDKYISCEIKNPNDIMIENKKLAGILVEGKIIGNQLQQVIIGVGINVINEIPDSLREIATKLSNYCDPPSVHVLAAEVSLSIINMLEDCGLI